MSTAATSTALTQAAAGGLAAFAGPNNPFLVAANKVGVTDGGFLRINGKTGEYITGDQKTLQPGTELVFLMQGCKLAWQAFDSDNKLHKGPEVSIISGQALPPHQAVPGVPDTKWMQVIKVLVAPTDTGKQMTLTCKANNQYREIWRLVKSYGEQVGRFPDGEGGYRSPIVEINARGYDMKVKEKKVHPTTNEIFEEEMTIKNYSEVFKIVGWITDAEMAQIKADADAAAGVGADATGNGAAAAQLSAPVAAASPTVNAAAATPVAAVAATTQTAAPAAAVAPTAQAAGAPLQGEVIPPAAGAQPSFRRGRVGLRT